MNKLEYISCDLCGKVEESLLYKINGLRVVRCNNCGLVYVNPRPVLDVLKSIYTENYFKNYAYQKLDESNYFGYSEYIEDEENIIKKFRRKLKLLERFSKSKGRLLDVGCACGFFMKLAKANGWEVEGIEISEFAVDYIRKRFGFKVYSKPLEEIGFPSDYFDAITMWDVIEHLPSPRRSIREVYRILKTGGVLGIITPDIGSFVARILGKNWLELKRIKEHIYFFSKKTLLRLLEEEGFRILYITTAGKHIKLKTILKELGFMKLPFIKALSKLIKSKSWLEKSIYIDPLYKLTVYAMK